MSAEQQNTEVVPTNAEEAPVRGNRITRTPAYQVQEAQDKLQVHVELPGAHKDDIQIDMEDRLLVIKASTTAPDLPAGMRCLREEFTLGDYEARFQIPAWIDRGNVEAQYDNGILSLSLSRVAPERTRIPILES